MTNVTIYALQRVLHHLGEDEQAKQPRYNSAQWQARAQARVIVKRVRAAEAQLAADAWQAAKGANDAD